MSGPRDVTTLPRIPMPISAQAPAFEGPATAGSPVILPALHDAADAWEFPAPEPWIEGFLPLKGIAWFGALPKRYKSLLLLYVALASAAGRPTIAGRFRIAARPRILYIAREDGGSRIRARRDDILRPWDERPERGALRFMIRPMIDLANPAVIDAIRDLCLAEGFKVVVLDTWTALSPSADPLGTKDQSHLAAAVVRLAEEIDGLVVVVDHSRKNRPDGQPLTSADLFGPPQKWAAAEHIVMLDLVGDAAGRKRIEVFTEGKDIDGTRLFLDVSPRGSGEEKFTFAGTVAEIAEARRAEGDANRQKVLAALRRSDTPLNTAEVAGQTSLSKATASRHLRALAEAGEARKTGAGRATRYFALDISRQGPSDAILGDADD